MAHRKFLLSAALVLAAITGAFTENAPAASAEQILTPQTFIDISRQVLPAVVSIDVEVPPSERLRDGLNGDENLDPMEFWRRFNRQDFGSYGSGSGVIVEVRDDWAYVLTNTHVLENNERVEYTISLDTNFLNDEYVVGPDGVEVVGYDELTDLAVVRFQLPDGVRIEPAEFADSDQVQVGEWVLALGSPLELNNSVSQGIISARNRDIDSANRIETLLQTTAIINPGNSGGPLVNLEGRIVGINNAIATNTGQWSGVGFAIPSNTAKRVSELLIRDGSIARGFLGIIMQDAPADIGGVSVIDVSPNTPAERAGLEDGDIVVAVDGRPVESPRELLAAIGNRFAGDEVDITLRRGDERSREERVLKVTLTERPPQDELRRGRMSPNRGYDAEQEAGSRELSRLGISVEEEEIDGTSGLEVTRVEAGGPAARAGLRKGDFLVQVNTIDTQTTEDLYEGLVNVRPGKSHVILFRRNGSNQFVTIDQ